MKEKPKTKNLYPFTSKEKLIEYQKNYYLSRYHEGYNDACKDWEVWFEQLIETIKTNSYALTFKSFDDYRKTVIRWLEEGLN